MNFNKDTLWDLRQEIRLGSLFYDDYRNSFGVDKHDCCDFFDGFIEWYEDERFARDSLGQDVEFEDWFYDNPEDLWNYYCLYEEEPLPIQEDNGDWEYESKKIKSVNRTVKKTNEEYIKGEFEDEAKRFCDAIRELASNEDALWNFENYISHHFQVWLDKWARTPEDIISEFKNFAEVNF